jgi:demethylmenaquinone methyltransferase/2-methoxy-6-polyprenyl-1,4-benzoquinol methylase
MSNDYRPGMDTRHLFDRIAPRYDLLNRLLSFGIDRRWRRAAVQVLELAGNALVLDAATGTADVALAIAAAHPAVRVVGVDLSANMLRAAAAKSGLLAERIRLLQGSCENLPLRAELFEGAVIAFGIRNVLNREAALREFYRVLKPGGRLAVLEFSRPPGFLLGRLYRFYSHWVLPRIGSLLSDGSAYRYLPDSVEVFPSRYAFMRLMEHAGFRQVCHCDLTGGIATLYSGCRPLHDPLRETGMVETPNCPGQGSPV